MITTQDGLTAILPQRIIGATVFFWPQLREEDIISYDVILHTAGQDIVAGRYTTQTRAEEIRDAILVAVASNDPAATDYAAPNE